MLYDRELCVAKKYSSAKCESIPNQKLNIKRQKLNLLLLMKFDSLKPRHDNAPYEPAPVEAAPCSYVPLENTISSPYSPCISVITSKLRKIKELIISSTQTYIAQTPLASLQNHAGSEELLKFASLRHLQWSDWMRSCRHA